MANMNKERRAYMDGMAFALKIARESGIEGLEKEIEFRGLTNAPLNVSRAELIEAARYRAKDELQFVATATASTLTEFIKMPPSKVLDYLREFNRRVKLYQYNPDEYEAAQTRLNLNIGLNDVCRLFTEEDEENGK